VFFYLFLFAALVANEGLIKVTFSVIVSFLLISNQLCCFYVTK